MDQGQENSEEQDSQGNDVDSGEFCRGTLQSIEVETRTIVMRMLHSILLAVECRRVDDDSNSNYKSGGGVS